MQDAKAEDEVIAEDMDLGRMHPNDDGRFMTKEGDNARVGGSGVDRWC